MEANIAGRAYFAGVEPKFRASIQQQRLAFSPAAFASSASRNEKCNSAGKLGSNFSGALCYGVEPKFRASIQQHRFAFSPAASASYPDRNEVNINQSDSLEAASTFEQHTKLTTTEKVFNKGAVLDLKPKARPPRPKVDPGRGGQAN
ncbi:hypothetical protein Nepgr_008473 [Nepenthes gracilis]|uniref:Uncharacterized protein n=1 Tax=Nepenthes gracilis TaxID=150966 RepID=A0AAD3S8S2_NEPGR|nr:hypothetical protein Nepgr_008473 [Nepenthes gracilis]